MINRFRAEDPERTRIAVYNNRNRPVPNMTTRPTSSQRDLLLQLQSSPRPIPKSELDGRVVRGLLARGWASEGKRAVSLTDAGREAIHHSEAARPAKRRRRSKGNARAAVIQRAVETLRSAVPPDSELAVGSMFAHIDDVLDGFRKIAKEMNAKK